MKKLYSAALLAGLLFLGAGCTSGSVTSTKPTICTMEYNPVCGFVPVTCVRAPCYPQPHTFSNLCMARAGGAVEYIKGACAEDQRYPTSTLPLPVQDK